MGRVTSELLRFTSVDGEDAVLRSPPSSTSFPHDQPPPPQIAGTAGAPAGGRQPTPRDPPPPPPAAFLPPSRLPRLQALARPRLRYWLPLPLPLPLPPPPQSPSTWSLLRGCHQNLLHSYSGDPQSCPKRAPLLPVRRGRPVPVHGLALIFNATRLQVQLWHPVTGKQLRLAVPREFGTAEGMLIQNGAVLRADGYVHTGRRSSPSPSPSTLKVVLVGQDVRYTRAFACVYSFETRLWSNLISTPLPSRNNSMGVPNVIPGRIPCLISMDDPGVLIGNSLYWNLLGNSRAILELDLDRHSLSVIPMPVETYADHGASFRVMPAEGGGLGLFFLSDFSAQLWNRKTSSDGVASWVMGRTVELDKLLSLDSVASLSIQGFAEDSNVVFLQTPIDLFMVQLESLHFRKLFETRLWCIYHPFASVYTAETGIGVGRDGAELSHKS